MSYVRWHIHIYTLGPKRDWHVAAVIYCYLFSRVPVYFWAYLLPLLAVIVMSGTAECRPLAGWSVDHFVPSQNEIFKCALGPHVPVENRELPLQSLLQLHPVASSCTSRSGSGRNTQLQSSGVLGNCEITTSLHAAALQLKWQWFLPPRSLAICWFQLILALWAAVCFAGFNFGYTIIPFGGTKAYYKCLTPASIGLNSSIKSLSHCCLLSLSLDPCLGSFCPPGVQHFKVFPYLRAFASILPTKWKSSSLGPLTLQGWNI